jgi:type VI secretion system ImpM family protein
MFDFLKRGRSEVGAVCGFGKVPALGDFVRTPKGEGEMTAFEHWLARAMETGEQRDGAAFKEAFAKAAPHAFLWSAPLTPKTRGLLAGVIVPSHDAVGRRFPIVLCVPLPVSALAAAPHVAPFVLHEFFLQALPAAQRAARAPNQAEFHAQIAAIHPPALDVASAVAKWDAWAQGHRLSDTLAPLLGGDPQSAVRYALYIVIEATKAYRGQDAPPLTLGLRTPLGSDVRTGGALWLDVIRHAAGWKSAVPSVFFPLGVPEPRALVQLGAEPPATVIADLVAATAGDAVCDVVMAPSARMPSELPPSATRALGNASIADALAELGR